MTGCEVQKVEENGTFEFVLSQKMYCEALEEAKHGELNVETWTTDLSNPERVLDKAEWTIYKGQVGALQWACVGTRADAVFRTASLAGRQAEPKVADVLEASKAIRELKREVLEIRYKPIKQEEMAMVLFTDAGHKNLPGGHSMGAWSLWLIPKPETLSKEYEWVPAHCLGYAGRRCRRACKSPMGAELIAMTEGWDKIAPITDFVQKVLGKMDVYLITDSESIVTMTSKQSSPEEKRLASDATIVVEAVMEGVKLRWVETQDMISDAMTKLMSCKVLRSTLNQGQFMVPLKFLTNPMEGIKALERSSCR